jgi:hypothetical protein
MNVVCQAAKQQHLLMEMHHMFAKHRLCLQDPLPRI